MSTSRTHRLARIASCSVASAVALGARNRVAYASGTAVDLQGARSTGMASAMIAHVDDSSGIYYNPSGIARGAGVLDAQVGVTLLIPRIQFTSTSGQTTPDVAQVVPPPNAFFTYGVHDQVTVGLGLSSPFGTSVKWPNDWQGRTLSTTSVLQTFYIQPTLGVRLGPVRLGSSLQIVRGVVDLRRALNFVDSTGEAEFGGATCGGGVSAGAQVDVLPNRLSLGLSYRSAVKLTFDGAAQFIGVPASLQATLHDQPVRTALTQPDTFGLGVAGRPTEGLLVDFDLVYTTWQRVKSLDIFFPNDTSGTLSSSSVKNWSGTLNYHLGGEYTVTPNLRVRAGVIYDPTPSPENTLTPEIPDASRINLAVGGSYAFDDGLRVELGYECLFFMKQTGTAPQLPGSYGGDVQIVGLSVGYHR